MADMVGLEVMRERNNYDAPEAVTCTGNLSDAKSWSVI